MLLMLRQASVDGGGWQGQGGLHTADAASLCLLAGAAASWTGSVALLFTDFLALQGVPAEELARACGHLETRGLASSALPWC